MIFLENKKENKKIALFDINAWQLPQLASQRAVTGTCEISFIIGRN